MANLRHRYPWLLEGRSRPLNRALYERLIEAAREQELVSLGELGDLMGLAMDYPPQRTEMAQLLGIIARHEVTSGRPMLTSLVVDEAEETPGEQLFELGEELYLVEPGETPGSFTLRQQSETFAFWAADDSPSVDAAANGPTEDGRRQLTLRALAVRSPTSIAERAAADFASVSAGLVAERAGALVAERPQAGPTVAERPQAGSAAVAEWPPTRLGDHATSRTPVEIPPLNEVEPELPPQPRQAPAPALLRPTTGLSLPSDPGPPDPDAPPMQPGQRPGIAVGPGLGQASGPTPSVPPSAQQASLTLEAGAQPVQTTLGPETDAPTQAPAQAPVLAPEVDQSGAPPEQSQAPAVESAAPVVQSAPAQPARRAGPTPTVKPASHAKAIHDPAVRWVMQLERAAGRKPVDRRDDPSFPGDIESKPRTIVVSALAGRSSSGEWALTLGARQFEEARRNPSFYIYAVENTHLGDPTMFSLKVLNGTRLREFLGWARERHYFEMRWPISHRDAAPGFEALADDH
jgi:hypothetical protein